MRVAHSKFTCDVGLQRFLHMFVTFVCCFFFLKMTDIWWFFKYILLKTVILHFFSHSYKKKIKQLMS